VHTDCLGRKLSPQRSQNTIALPGYGKSGPVLQIRLRGMWIKKLLV
jgi:hypothetical protein